MAQHAIASVHQLDAGFVLAPERYDPRRRLRDDGAVPIVDFVDIISDVIAAEKAPRTKRYLVLDTSDASEGIVRTSKSPVTADGIGSTKKIVQPGDVIISRLRPYLRQVAYIDLALSESETGVITIVCSTEFFVLRGRAQESIAFIVPFLLAGRVQDVLSVSQEGGHHPRFNQSTLRAIRVPDAIARERRSLSALVENYVKLARRADLGIRSLIAKSQTELDNIDQSLPDRRTAQNRQVRV